MSEGAIDATPQSASSSPSFPRLRRWGGLALRLVAGLALTFVVPQLVLAGSAPHIGPFAATAASVACAVGLFFVVVRLTEGRWPRDFAPGPAIVELSAGLAAGIVLSATSVTLLWLLGFYKVIAVAPTAQFGALLLPAFARALQTAFVEEIAFRGVITRQVALTVSPAAALVVSALVFGGLHLLNPGASLRDGVSLVVEAGLLLAAAYLLTKRLWLPIGLHLAWNFMQEGIVGGAVSGNAVRAILTARPDGPDWLSGGAFGIEGSVVSTLVCATAAAALLYAANRRGLPWSRPMSADR